MRYIRGPVFAVILGASHEVIPFPTAPWDPWPQSLLDWERPPLLLECETTALDRLVGDYLASYSARGLSPKTVRLVTAAAGLARLTRSQLRERLWVIAACGGAYFVSRSTLARLASSG